jgi:nucleoside-triphosphatase THEP1
MNHQHGLNEKWIKASILGTMWASSEIVFGSFLHNLRIPFSGNILTGIGLVILISVGHLWTEKGLFWRAGLLTAMMKTLSPSAVIFGPMIAIMAESILLEISVRILGRATTGYLLGAVLAMSWNLVQKLANFILFYGYNIVALYTNLIRIAQKLLGIQFDILWLPILLVLAIDGVLGAASAIIGIRIGRRMLNQSAISQTGVSKNRNSVIPNYAKSDFNYSLVWLPADILFMLSALFLLSTCHWMVWSFSISVLITVWAIRYKRALRQLAKPKFWVYFVLITMLTALVFSNNADKVHGLLMGLQMNFRAAVIILGLAVLGTELYNPKIREFLKQSSFKQLPVALELSLAGLPSAIADLPDAKTLVKNPIMVLYQLLSNVENRLAEIKNRTGPKIFIVTGAIGQGKSTCIQNIITMLREANISIGGIYSPKIIDQGITVGYDIINIQSGEREIFLRLDGERHFARIGRFYIYPAGLQKGKGALTESVRDHNRITIIDEVGRLELENQGWAKELDLINSSHNHILLTMRDGFAEELIRKLNLKPMGLYNIAEYDYKAIGAEIIKSITNCSVETKQQDGL